MVGKDLAGSEGLASPTLPAPLSVRDTAVSTDANSAPLFLMGIKERAAQMQTLRGGNTDGHGDRC